MEALSQKKKASFEPVITDFSQNKKSIKFKRDDLIQELLSLGHRNITLESARLLATEVENEIHRRHIQYLSSELISELLEAKLEEFGLLQNDQSRLFPQEEDSSLNDTEVKEEVEEEVLELLALDPQSQEIKEDHQVKKTISSKKYSPISYSQSDCVLIQSDLAVCDEEGQPIEDVKDIFLRVSKTLAEAESKYNPLSNLQDIEISFYNLLAEKKFIPEKLCLKNAGRSLSPLQSSYVLSIKDSTESIFDGMKEAALVHKHGSSCSFSFNSLRPKDDLIHSKSHKARGPLSFITVYSKALETLFDSQKISDRVLIHVDHPDILEFLEKDSFDNLGGLRFTLGISDAFMEAVSQGKIWSLINPRNSELEKQVKARTLFKAIVDRVWSKASPDIVFLDRLSQSKPLHRDNQILSAEGDLLLKPQESAARGSLNLNAFIKEGQIDWEDLEQSTQRAIEFLDNQLDCNTYPAKTSKEISESRRLLSLSVVSWESILNEFHNGFEVLEDILKFIKKTARSFSEKLGHRRSYLKNPSSKSFDQARSNQRNSTITGFNSMYFHPKLSCLSSSYKVSSLEEGLKLQSLFQDFSDHAVCMTQKLNTKTGKEEIAFAIFQAHAWSLKNLYFSYESHQEPNKKELTEISLDPLPQEEPQLIKKLKSYDEDEVLSRSAYFNPFLIEED